MLISMAALKVIARHLTRIWLIQVSCIRANLYHKLHYSVNRFVFCKYMKLPVRISSESNCLIECKYMYEKLPASAILIFCSRSEDSNAFWNHEVYQCFQNCCPSLTFPACHLPLVQLWAVWFLWGTSAQNKICCILAELMFSLSDYFRSL